MTENGTSKETVSTEQSTSGSFSGFGSMPSPDAIARMLADMTPEQRQQIAELGMAVGQKMNASQRPVIDTTAVVVQESTATPAPIPTQQTPPTPAVQVQASPSPDFPTADPPPGYVRVPEGVYLWTPSGSGGIPLWGLLAGGRAREGSNPGRLVFKLLKPAYSFTRAGKRVVVPTGGWVMATLTDALEPFLQWTTNKEACVAMWLRPIGEIPLDGGGTLAAIDAQFEASPSDRSQPRLYPRDLLKRA